MKHLVSRVTDQSLQRRGCARLLPPSPCALLPRRLFRFVRGASSSFLLASQSQKTQGCGDWNFQLSMEQPTLISAASGFTEELHELQLEAVEEHVEVVKHRCQPKLQPGAEEKLVLQFMDSLHGYLSLSHALSSTLQQGWMELASARQSMVAARISSSVLDLTFHSAATRLNITEYDVDSIDTKPCFELRKWVSSEDIDDNSLKSSDDSEVQKERSKSLSTFGILISPKLRAAQLSFERALETLVEIANMQSSLQCSFNQLHQQLEDTKE